MGIAAARMPGAMGAIAKGSIDGMEFLRRLRGGPAGGVDAAAMGRLTFFADGVAETGDGLIWVELSMSPSGAFALLLRDATDDGSAGGFRSTGLGRYRLIEKGAGLRCDGRLERPNDGHVADTGTFILADWLFTDELRGRLHVFAADGTELIRRECRANVLSTYMDAEGRYAAAQMASNPEDDHDDERFIVFDVTRRSELWLKPLEVGRPDSAEFDVAAGALWITTTTFGRMRYGLADGFVDLAELRERALVNGDGFAILGLVEDEVAAGVQVDRREVLVDACLRASGRLAEYPRHAARAFRLAGEIVEGSDASRTLAFWDRALTLDPKVGISKRAAALRDKSRGS